MLREVTLALNLAFSPQEKESPAHVFIFSGNASDNPTTNIFKNTGDVKILSGGSGNR